MIKTFSSETTNILAELYKRVISLEKLTSKEKPLTRYDEELNFLYDVISLIKKQVFATQYDDIILKRVNTDNVI